MARHSNPGRSWLTDFRCQGVTSRGHQCRRYGDTTTENPTERDVIFEDCVRCRAHAEQPNGRALLLPEAT